MSQQFDSRQEYLRGEEVLRGYVSQFNRINGKLDARTSGMLKNRIKCGAPEGIVCYLRTYKKYEELQKEQTPPK